MEQLLIFLFWLSIVLLGYTYLLYPGFMWLVGEKPGALPILPEPELPPLALLVNVEKPEPYLQEQIQTFFDTNYPADKLEVVVGYSPGLPISDSVSADFGHAHPRLKLLPLAADTEAQQQLVAATNAPILIFIRPGTSLKPHSLSRLAAYYTQPNVGGVQPRMLNIGTLVDQTLEQEVLYTRYDQRIQQGESQLGMLIGAQPACYSLRRDAFSAAPPDIADKGLFAYMHMIRKGYRLVFGVDAVYSMEVAGSLEKNLEAQITQSQNNYQSLSHYSDFLNPARQPLASLMFWSHKVLRWFTPHLLVLALLLHLLLVFVWDYGRTLLWLHLAFYVLATLDLLLAELGQHLKPLRIIRHFMSANLAQLIGFIRYLKSRKATKNKAV